MRVGLDFFGFLNRAVTLHFGFLGDFGFRFRVIALLLHFRLFGGRLGARDGVFRVIYRRVIGFLVLRRKRRRKETRKRPRQDCFFNKNSLVVLLIFRKRRKLLKEMRF